MNEMPKRILEFTLLASFGLGMGYLIMEHPPEPPPGVCDGSADPKECREWWYDIMERP